MGKSSRVERSNNDGRMMCEAAGGLTGGARVRRALWVSLGVDQEPKKLIDEKEETLKMI